MAPNPAILPRTFHGIQALRALAVILVVFHHASRIVQDRLQPGFPSLHLGNAGVDIFFVISGFVIFLTLKGGGEAQWDWRRFLRRRFLRIAPLYWLATSLKLAVMAALPAFAMHTGLEIWHAFASYLFIPAYNVEGEVLPVLLQGWTLSFEMFFYLCFAAMLALRRSPIEWLSGLFLLLAMVGLTVPPDSNALLVLLNPLLLEFVLGLWIARFVRSGMRMPPLLAMTMLLIALAAFAYGCLLPESACIRHRFVLWGVPSALLVFGMAALEPAIGARLRGLPHLLGDASYAIYLFHGFAIQACVMVVAPLAPDAWKAASVMILAPIGALVSGVIMHRGLEKPMTDWLRRRFDAPSPRIA